MISSMNGFWPCTRANNQLISVVAFRHILFQRIKQLAARLRKLIQAGMLIAVHAELHQAMLSKQLSYLRGVHVRHD